MEAAAEIRESQLGELASSKYAPGPGLGSGPYEQKRMDIYVRFYGALFRKVVDNWFEVLARQNGHVSASDVDHILKEVEEWASNAPRNIQSAMISRGTTASRLPQETITALGDNSAHKIRSWSLSAAETSRRAFTIKTIPAQARAHQVWRASK